MNEVTDHYATLELAPGASVSEVKARFRQLAMTVHPDRNANAPECQERLKRINAAYEFLSDTSRKAAYDARRLSAAVLTPVQNSHSSISLDSRPPSGRGAAHFLALIALCVCLGVLTAVLACAGSFNPPGDVTPTGVTIIELPPVMAGPANGAADSMTPSHTSLTTEGDILPVSDEGQWPPTPAPPAAPTSDLVGPDPTPSVTDKTWPALDTGPFPSR